MTAFIQAGDAVIPVKNIASVVALTESTSRVFLKKLGNTPTHLDVAETTLQIFLKLRQADRR